MGESGGSAAAFRRKHFRRRVVLVLKPILMCFSL